MTLELVVTPVGVCMASLVHTAKLVCGNLFNIISLLVEVERIILNSDNDS